MFRSLADAIREAEARGLTLSAVALEAEAKDQGRPIAEIRDALRRALHVMQGAVDRVVAMKREGVPVLNPEPILNLLLHHFREEKAPEETMPCRVGLRDLFIRPDGKVEACFFYPPIGSIKAQGAREIGYGPKAQEIRR